MFLQCLLILEKRLVMRDLNNSVYLRNMGNYDDALENQQLLYSDTAERRDADVFNKELIIHCPHLVSTWYLTNDSEIVWYQHVNLVSWYRIHYSILSLDKLLKILVSNYFKVRVLLFQLSLTILVQWDGLITPAVKVKLLKLAQNSVIFQFDQLQNFDTRHDKLFRGKMGSASFSEI